MFQLHKCFQLENSKTPLEAAFYQFFHQIVCIKLFGFSKSSSSEV